MVLGKPFAWSLPLTSMVFSSFKGKTEPICILTSSAVVSPMTRLCFLLKYCTIQSSISSPATSRDFATTIPPSEMTATSVVPPPMSQIMLACGSDTGSSEPMAAAIGSSIRYTSLAPACSADSCTARFSTSVMPDGMPITIRGCRRLRLLWTFRMKYLIISCVTSKSAITPLRRGRTATILEGVRPSISLASDPTASTFLWFLSIATTDGSRRTMPLPFT